VRHSEASQSPIDHSDLVWHKRILTAVIDFPIGGAGREARAAGGAGDAGAGQGAEGGVGEGLAPPVHRGMGHRHAPGAAHPLQGQPGAGTPAMGGIGGGSRGVHMGPTGVGGMSEGRPLLARDGLGTCFYMLCKQPGVEASVCLHVASRQAIKVCMLMRVTLKSFGNLPGVLVMGSDGGADGSGSKKGSVLT
jgi:hypothetical protein